MVEIKINRDQITEIKLNNLNKSFWSKIGNRMVSSTQNKINKGIQPANAPLTTAVKSGSKTLRDRGQLISSLSKKADDESVSVGTNRSGARINHFGGTVSASRTWLFIPASSWTRTQQKKYGFTVTSVLNGLRSSGWNVYFRINRNKQQGVVAAVPVNEVGSKNKRMSTKVVFILKKRVVIPARPFLFVSDEDKAEIKSVASREIKVNK